MSGKTELIENRSALTSHTHCDSNVNSERYIAHMKRVKRERNLQHYQQQQQQNLHCDVICDASVRRIPAL